MRYVATQFGHALLPENLAVCDAGTNQVPPAAHCIDAIAVHSGRSTRTVAATFLENRTDFGKPKLFAGVRVEREENFTTITRAHCEKFAADNGRSGVALAGIFVEPHALRTFGGPRLEQTGFLGDVRP